MELDQLYKSDKNLELDTHDPHDESMLYLILIYHYNLKLYSHFEPIFRLSMAETEGDFLKSTYYKFLLCPTVKLPYKLGRSIRGTQFDSSKDIYSRDVM